MIVSLGGQTAINLAEPLAALGAPIIGSGIEAIRNAEDRGCFESIMEKLQIPQPEGVAVTNIEDGVKAAERIGIPGARAPKLCAWRTRDADFRT